MIEQVAESLWVAEGECVSFMGLAYPTRSVIVRLDNGDLWIWSPVKLSAELGTTVDRMGPVRHLVSPYKLHHIYLPEWHAAYPDALLWGPRSTIRKCPDLPFQEPLRDAPPAQWQADIDQAWFRGSFAMDELAFFTAPPAPRSSPTSSRPSATRSSGSIGDGGASWPRSTASHRIRPRSLGLAIVVHQPRARPSRARQGAGVELPAHHPGAWRIAALEPQRIPEKVAPLAWVLLHQTSPRSPLN